MHRARFSLGIISIHTQNFPSETLQRVSRYRLRKIAEPDVTVTDTRYWETGEANWSTEARTSAHLRLIPEDQLGISRLCRRSKGKQTEMQGNSVDGCNRQASE